MVEEVAKSCDFVAAVEAEVQECTLVLNPSLGGLMGIFALVYILAEAGSFALLERVCSDRDSVVRQPDL